MHNCSHCGKSFARPEHLERHMLLHSHTKPFSCLQCNKSFARRDALKRHYETHHPEPEHQTAQSTTARPALTYNNCSSTRSQVPRDRSSPRETRNLNCAIKTTTQPTSGPPPQYVVYSDKSGRPQLSLRIPSNSDGIADVAKYMLSTAHPESSSSGSCSSASSCYTEIAFSPVPTRPTTLGWNSTTSSPISAVMRQKKMKTMPQQSYNFQQWNYPWMVETPR